MRRHLLTLSPGTPSRWVGSIAGRTQASPQSPFTGQEKNNADLFGRSALFAIATELGLAVESLFAAADPLRFTWRASLAGGFFGVGGVHVHLNVLRSHGCRLHDLRCELHFTGREELFDLSGKLR